VPARDRDRDDHEHDPRANTETAIGDDAVEQVGASGGW
jgi:hypothetical protein